MSSFNGWTIVTPPATPVPRSIEWMLGDTVAANRSPFSQQQQIYNWGASILRASVSYPAMLKTEGQPWAAFLASLQGIANIFQFGDPLNTAPQNVGVTPGAVSGGGQVGYTLVTTSSGLAPGDWIQIGLRLYMVTASFMGTLGIWPQLRESPTDGTGLVVTNTQGLFRLTKNDRKYSVNDAKVYGITFEIEEAI
jgi:hypothetical protein